ncbi:hypothetical protein NPIL_701021 [Nephila pilipes]|uniref:Uncharacterized protein n=1 Tax=Nephila pilipes TaxID=299642 RepID=A0A8X6T6H8_NEPPI|nr:hypothetical protein NPIL_701021 [Nephila pilipes]
MMDKEVDQPPVKIQCLEGNIKKIISKTLDKDKMMSDLALSKMLYACSIPFAVVESKSFKNLIHILRPSFKPPSHKELAGPLLNAVYNEIDGLVC